MITPTPAPAIVKPRLLFIPLTYALLLACLAVWQLVMFKEFAEYAGSYLGGSMASGVALVSMVLIGMEVFSLPFLLRLRLSRLARFCSAGLVFLTPLAWAAITTAGSSFNLTYLFINILFFVWGGVSFWVLGGPRAMRLSAT